MIYLLPRRKTKALDEILPEQINDFEGIFRIMSPHPVIIRYLDPPLHEFLPKETDEKEELAKTLNINLEELNIRINNLIEVNPMMGHRGCRIAITYPEIAVMQTKAIIKAAINITKEGKKVHPKL